MFGVIVFFVIVAVIAIMQYLLSTKPIRFEYSNISSVLVSKINENSSESVVGTITDSGSSLRLEKDSSYLITYTADKNYADGSTTIVVNDDTKVIKLDPYYSTEKLSSMLDPELTQVHQVIRDNYGEAINSYTIARGNLYHKGEWYGTTLVYIGGDPFVSDPLRVVLKKTDGVWKPATRTPEINLNTISYPDIPKDIMSATNVFVPTKDSTTPIE